MLDDHNLDCLVKYWIDVSRVKVTAKLKISVNVCPDDIFYTSEPFVTKFGIGCIISQSVL